MPPAPDCDPVGISDIARRSEVTVHAVRAWIFRRDDFPEPAGTINGERWWNWGDIDAWLKASGLPRKR